MDQLQRLLAQSGAGGDFGGAAPSQDVPKQDTSETIHISSLALLKVLVVQRWCPLPLFRVILWMILRLIIDALLHNLSHSTSHSLGMPLF